MNYVVGILFLFYLSQTSGQTNSGCTPVLDTTTVLKIAKAERFYPGTDTKFCAIHFDTLKCEWTLVTSKIRYINHGRCKRLNGCTEITTISSVIDDQNRTLKSRTRERKLYPHYE
ncbi:MAG: hypothetical protein HYZ14_12620 [Bacteroidetes bacterium]|nr:hypothetical protein [Bacteroidota bacterium]